MKTLLFIFRQAPYASARAREGLEALLAAAAYEQEPAVIFMADGIWQIIEQGVRPQTRSHNKMLKALPMYGVDKFFVHMPSAVARGQDNSPFILPCSPVDDAALAKLIAEFAVVFSY